MKTEQWEAASLDVRRLWDVRVDLCQAADALENLSKKSETRDVAKEAFNALNELLIDLDGSMEWDDD